MITMLCTPASSHEDLPAHLRAEMEDVRNLGDNKLSEVLITLLGCPYMSHFRPDYLRHPKYFVEHASVIEDALLELLPLVTKSNLWATLPICDAATLLVGFSRGSCLARCQNDESSSYDLAALTLHFVEGFSLQFPLDRETRPVMLNFLNAWLKPAVRWREIPSDIDVAHQMFGQPWLDLMLPSESSVPELVLSERPPFRTGLCLAQSPAPCMSLPDLEVGP
jgi:hypothetical protein